MTAGYDPDLQGDTSTTLNRTFATHRSAGTPGPVTAIRFLAIGRLKSARTRAAQTVPPVKSLASKTVEHTRQGVSSGCHSFFGQQRLIDS